MSFPSMWLRSRYFGLTQPCKTFWSLTACLAYQLLFPSLRHQSMCIIGALPTSLSAPPSVDFRIFLFINENWTGRLLRFEVSYPKAKRAQNSGHYTDAAHYDDCRPVGAGCRRQGNVIQHRCIQNPVVEVNTRTHHLQ